MRTSLAKLLWLFPAWLLLTACGSDLSPAQRLAEQMAESLMQVESVMGRLEISNSSITLEQELWVQPPMRLRTETNAGPEAFKGTIVVLNDQEGWFYSPALNMATVAQRSGFDAELAQEAGAGSMLERLPTTIVKLLQTSPSLNEAGREEIAGRMTRRIELFATQAVDTIPAGALQVWLDEEFAYPLALTMSNQMQIRFTWVQFNQPIDPVTFIFVPPPGAQVQRLADRK
jgi:outer membrane lipoprotein-sorting protein